MCWNRVVVKLYDVIAHGEKKYGLPEEEVTRLYVSGVLDRRSPCRVYGSDEWKSIDECLPLLKYTSQSLVSVEPAHLRPVRTTADRSTLDTDERGKPAKTTALRAGWICFGLGLLVAWFFPPAFFFFSVAIVTAVVAMCTRQVNQGLMLLISSFVGAGLCALVSFVLAVGVFAAVTSHAINEVREEMNKPRPNQPAVPRFVPFPTTPPRPLTVPTLPKVQTTVRYQQPAATPQRSIGGLTQREIFEEIARIEKEQRELRTRYNELPAEAQRRLEQLRAAQQ